LLSLAVFYNHTLAKQVYETVGGTLPDSVHGNTSEQERFFNANTASEIVRSMD